MSRPPTLFEWTDERLEGQLAEFLAERVEAGASHEEIAFALRERGVTVSRETVRRWCNDLGLEKAAAS